MAEILHWFLDCDMEVIVVQNIKWKLSHLALIGKMVNWEQWSIPKWISGMNANTDSEDVGLVV